MDLDDKRAWLGKHGFTVKYNFEGVALSSIGWRTTGGLHFLAEGSSYDKIWDNLFNDVKESLFERIINEHP